MSLVCFLLPLKREIKKKKCLTLAAYILCFETPGLPACYPLKLIIAKFRLKLKKVRKTTRPFKVKVK